MLNKFTFHKSFSDPITSVACALLRLGKVTLKRSSFYEKVLKHLFMLEFMKQKRKLQYFFGMKVFEMKQSRKKQGRQLHPRATRKQCEIIIEKVIGLLVSKSTLDKDDKPVHSELVKVVRVMGFTQLLPTLLVTTHPTNNSTSCRLVMNITSSSSSLTYWIYHQVREFMGLVFSMSVQSSKRHSQEKHK
ncbi:CLUMA_CG001525, isoform A [Clunio marinus]|uniref:CLUMA_CG001525, isoform A n=1 Tax=Clunio marinus TaxID=568069 RepID=A0A1J1HI69_9DIPT|nr:CLUMA_CG001525, isoform A [Clunio marinus]